jgi:hypothetical protein
MTNRRWFVVEYLAFLLYVGSFLVFLFAFSLNGAHYKTAIDPIGRGYSPFGIDQLPTLVTYQVLFWISGFALWFKERNLPPLFLVLAMSSLVIGIGINSVSLLQVTYYSEPNGTRSLYYDPVTSFLFGGYLVVGMILSIALIVRVIKSEGELAQTRHYKNKVLNQLNRFMGKVSTNPFWIVMMIFPIYMLVTVVLLLFGQSPGSLVTAFTDTTCWRFSQMSHPDYLPHQGHYLCTVAARGNPKLVKPIREGIRQGVPIIVNRQLMIANAFEELLQENLPILHKIIRNAYDTYGLPLSNYINKTAYSNITYLIMKPIEWIFLCTLYLCCICPEEKINKQYVTSNITTFDTV